MRFVGPITPVDRLVYGSRILQIVSAVNVEERNVEYLITAKEQV